MPNNNVAILSIMSKFDEKSAREAAKRADKVYEEALSDIGNVNFDKKLLENFDKAMNLLKNKFKKVNLSSYTNNLLDSIFSDKDIAEKNKDIEIFIKKIDLLKKASSGQDINAFNTFSSKQIEALISKTEKLSQKQNEINEKTREYNREATKIAKTNRNISTIDKNYGKQDYSKILESLKKSLGTEKEFTAEQNQLIENLAKMVNLYQVMEKSEPQKGTAEAIRYSKDLLAVTEKIKEERRKIDSFSSNGASNFINNNGLNSVNKVSSYTVNEAKQNFTKARLSNLKVQEANLQSELTTYISESVQKNLTKVSKEADTVIDKAEKRVENLQNKIDALQNNSNETDSNNSVIDSIVSESDIKTLEEIEDRLYAISDLDADGEATSQHLKEYIQLYKQYEQLIANDSTVKFDPGLKEEYDFIIESDNALKKYANTLDETVSKQKELSTLTSDNKENVSIDMQTEQLAKQAEQIKDTVQAEKQLQDYQERVFSNTKISVDVEQAISNINKIKENLDSIPNEKNIKVNVSSNDYSNTSLLSDAEGNTITAFRGVVGSWSGLINQDGIGFFTDKLKLAADYADSLAESGKVYQANLSFKNPLEVEGNGAKWDEIDFNGVKKTTDEIVELAKQLGHDGVIFKNIRDGFTDTDEDISNIMVALNTAQIKNEQVIGAVKAGTGEMVDVVSKIDSATDTTTISTVESQNKIQEELKETQKIAERVNESINSVTPDKSNILSENSIPQAVNQREQLKNIFQGDTEKSEMDEVTSATEEAVQAKKEFATANNEVQSSVEGSKSKLKLEAELMESISKNAREAANAKKEFVEANEKVRTSTQSSNDEIKKDKTKENINVWKELSYSIERYSEISKRISSGKSLDGDIEEAKRLENKISQLQKLDILSPEQINKSEQKLSKLYDKLNDIEKKSKEVTLKSLQSSVDGYTKNYNSRNAKPLIKNQSTEYREVLNEYYSLIKQLEEKKEELSKQPLITREDLTNIENLDRKIKKCSNELDNFSASQKGSTLLSRGKTIEWANNLLEENSKWSKKAKNDVQNWINTLETADSANVEKIRNEILGVVRVEREAGNEGKTWLDIFNTKKLHNFLGQAASMFSFYDLINLGKEGFNTIRELDTALTEMRKVSDETINSLKNYQATTFDVGDSVGATSQTIQNSTADWMRLGESINEAAESAKTSNILLNVSEFEDINDATKSLVSMSQAYQELDKIEIVDKLNNIGNNYSISTDELATGLQNAAAVLKTQGNDLNEAIALVTAGNAITQDASKTSSGIRTIALRIAGTEEAKDELQEIGEDVDDFIVRTSSKTQQIIKDYTAVASNAYQGVDVLDSNGNLRNTFNILLDIAKVYKEIQEEDKKFGTNRANALVEELAGKNRSNIASSILLNPELLESVYKTSQNSEGSAQAELDKYLDSIDGKMTQLENRAQEFWFKLIDSDSIKNGITLLTDFLEVATNIVDALGLLGTASLIGGGILGAKNIGKYRISVRISNN